jgi:hypothetical protein
MMSFDKFRGFVEEKRKNEKRAQVVKSVLARFEP